MIKNGILNLKVSLRDILYIQSEHVYVRIYLTNQQSVLHRNSLVVLEKELANENFLRIHRSYLVNIQAITRFSRRLIVIGDLEITISRSYRDKVTAVLGNWSSP